MVLNLRIGGAENLVCDMARLQSRQGNEVIICSLESQQASLRKVEETGFRIIYLNKRGGKDFRLLFRLVRLLKKEKPDILHTHNKAPLIYGALMRFLTRTPVLVNTRHGQGRLHQSFFIWNAYDFIVAVSHSAKNELLEHNRIEKNKVRVIHNGIDIQRFNILDAADQSLQKNGKIVIGIVARLDYYKDLPNLITSFQKVLTRINNAELWIVGDGNLRDDVEHRLKVLGLKEKVKLWGWQKDIAFFDRQIDVFVLPSLTEGISLALLEAMACGCPVVATRVGGNPEVVVDGQTGFLVPPKDPEAMAEAIITILQDKRMAQSMGEAGRRRVEEKFSLARMVNEYQKVYEEVLYRKRRLRVNNRQ